MLRPLAKCFTELGGTTGSLLRSIQALEAMQPDGTMAHQCSGFPWKSCQVSLIHIHEIKWTRWKRCRKSECMLFLQNAMQKKSVCSPKSLKTYIFSHTQFWVLFGEILRDLSVRFLLPTWLEMNSICGAQSMEKFYLNNHWNPIATDKVADVSEVDPSKPGHLISWLDETQHSMRSGRALKVHMHELFGISCLIHDSQSLVHLSAVCLPAD